MKRYQTIIVSMFQPTSYQGTRVRLEDRTYNNIIVIPYDYSCNSIREIAENWLKKEGFNPICYGSYSGTHDVIMIDDFKGIIDDTTD